MEAYPIGLSLLAGGDRNMPVPDFLKAARDGGYDGVEMWLLGEGGLNFDVTDEELAAYRKLAAEYNLTIYSVAISSPAGNMLASGKDAELFAEYAIRGMDIAVKLGAGTVLHTTGNLNGIDYETGYLNGIANLRKLAPEVEARNLQFALEFIWNGFLFSPIEMRNFLTQVNSANIGFYFDPGNMAVFQKPQDWVRVLKGFVRHVHLKDWKGRALNGGWTALLEGEVDYPAVMTELRKAGYKGPLVSEVALSLAPWEETAKVMRKVAVM
ncbi:MAG: sugar phosphate isomerase/epimerase [Lentisphaeria bacterium]|nr:sugar phosphate isomerase/epimerase [Lentisphaeria bacterium]